MSLSKGVVFFGLGLILLLLNFLVGGDVVSNFILGIISTIVAIALRRFVGENVTSFVGSLILAILLIPFFVYLSWFALVGARTLLSQVASQYLIEYITQNSILSLPSTVAGTIGGWLVELITDRLGSRC